MAKDITKYLTDEWEQMARDYGVYDQLSPYQLEIAAKDPAYGYGTVSNKIGYSKATNDEARASWNAKQEELNNSYGFYGGPEGNMVSYSPTLTAKNSALDAVTGYTQDPAIGSTTSALGSYSANSPYKAAGDASLAQLAGWGSNARSQQVEDVRNQLGSYGQGALPQAVIQQLKALGEYGDFAYDREPDYQAALDRVMNPDPFSYDYKTDPAYQAYAKQYTREGRRASEDTMGQYAAMTGGRPSTAAVTAGQQAGNYYASKLADKIPDLYNQAYQRYLSEFNKRLQGFNALQSDRSMRYGEYGDKYNRMSNYLAQLQSQDATEYARLVNYLTDLENTDQREYSRLADLIGQYQGMDQQEYSRLNNYLGQLMDQDNTAYSRALQNYDIAASEDAAARARVQDAEQTAYQRRLAEEDRQHDLEQEAVEDEWRQKEWDYGVSQDALDRQQAEYSQQRQQAIDAINYFGDYTKLAQLLGIDATGMSNEQVKYILVDSGLVNEDGTVNEETVTNAYKQTANTPDYKQAITDKDTTSRAGKDRAIVNDTYTGLPSSATAGSGASVTGTRPSTAAIDGITTQDRAINWLASQGLSPRDWQIPNEAAFNRGKDDPNSDYYGYSSYAQFLRDYVQYIYSEFGGNR